MDKLKLIFEKHNDLKGVEFKTYDIKVQLNEAVLPHSVLNVGSILPLYQFKFAKFDLFTCSCGEPGCAGFQHHVVHSIENNVVCWKFPETNDYKTDKKIYLFEKEQFEKELKSTFIKMKELEKENKYHVTIIGYDYDEEDEEENNKQFIIENSIQESFDWYSDNFQGKQNFYDILNDENNTLSNKKFYWVYDGQVAKEKIELSSLVGNILNQFPYKSHEPFYLAKVKLTIKAIKQMLEGNNDLINKLAKHGYGRYGLSNYNLINWYFYDTVTEESFDMKKLSLKMVMV